MILARIHWPHLRLTLRVPGADEQSSQDRWSEVAAWAGADPASVADAQVIAVLNAKLDLRNRAPALAEDARSFVASLE